MAKSANRVVKNEGAGPQGGGCAGARKVLIEVMKINKLGRMQPNPPPPRSNPTFFKACRITMNSDRVELECPSLGGFGAVHEAECLLPPVALGPLLLCLPVRLVPTSGVHNFLMEGEAAGVLGDVGTVGTGPGKAVLLLVDAEASRSVKFITAFRTDINHLKGSKIFIVPRNFHSNQVGSLSLTLPPSVWPGAPS